MKETLTKALEMVLIVFLFFLYFLFLIAVSLLVLLRRAAAFVPNLWRIRQLLALLFSSIFTTTLWISHT